MSDPQHITAANVVAWCGVGLSHVLSSIGIHTWGDFAAMCAAALSIVTLADWVWRKVKARRSE